jgi:hypothetical protein
MSESQPRPNVVKGLLISAMLFGCAGLAVVGGIGFFVFWACSGTHL